MSDYKEQVNSLREHADLIETSIELYGPSATRLLVYDLRNAAAAIEDMAKHITEMHERVTVLQIERGHLETEVKELRSLNNENLLPKLGEWELIDGAEPMRWGCSRCKYLSWETSNYCPRCGAKMEVQE